MPRFRGGIISATESSPTFGMWRMNDVTQAIVENTWGVGAVVAPAASGTVVEYLVVAGGAGGTGTTGGGGGAGGVIQGKTVVDSSVSYTITVGSGGLIGTGLFNGPQTNGRFVPEQQTDFIFTVAGEQLGFIGSGAILILYLILLMRGFSIARRTNDPFGRLVCTGVIAWFAFQIFENIGMTMGLMPMTGVPLPFISYGGSSMFATLIGIGLLQNVHARLRG